MKQTVLERDAPRSVGLSALAIAAALVVASCGGGGDDAVSDARASALGVASCDTRVNNTHAKLLECVTLAGVRRQVERGEIAESDEGLAARRHALPIDEAHNPREARAGLPTLSRKVSQFTGDNQFTQRG